MRRIAAQGVFPDPCLRHLDLAVTIIPGITDDVHSVGHSGSDADSSVMDDDSELETSTEEGGSPGMTGYYRNNTVLGILD